ncbi:MAG: hypothetical protein FWH32_02615 [Clostridiales bacterium]|nr:hypothetical protein [Clostridiales bacterium]
MKSGAFKGLRTAGMLLRIVVPVYIIVVLVGYTGAYLWLAGAVEPAMRIFALPGEAVVPLITGVFSDEYGVVAAMGAFSFSHVHITIIAMISLCFHSIPVETVVARKIGLPPWRTMLFRFVLAVATGILVALLMSAYSSGASAAFTSAPVSIAGELTLDFDWGAILPAIGFGVLNICLTILRIVIPMMIVIEIMIAYKIVHMIAEKLAPVCRLLGIGQDALLPLIIGLLLGVTYGAGAIMELNRSQPLPKRDITLLGIFLFSCHGIIEVTYLFTVAGGNAFVISIVRLAIAVGVTAAAARLFAAKTQKPD